MDFWVMRAIRRGKVEELKVLIETDLSLLNGTTPRGSTPLHMAARFGHSKMVDEILRHSPSLLTLQNQRGDTALHVAARAGHLKVVISFISRIPDHLSLLHYLSLTNVELDMPLHDAIMNCHDTVALEMIHKFQLRPELLLEVNKAGESPLSLAVDVNLYGVVGSILKACPSSLSHKNVHGLTVLHTAILRNNFGIMKLLLETDSKLAEGVDLEGKSPLHYAAALGDISMVQEVVKSDRSLVYLSDNTHRSPLHMAAQYGRLDVLKALLRTCPDSVEQIDKDHRNVLHLAAQYGMRDVVTYLMKLPDVVDLINATDMDGNTPLHLASAYYHDSVVYALLHDHRVDLSKTNNDDFTALEIAETQANQRQTFCFLSRCSNSATPPNSKVNQGKIAPVRKMGYQKNLTIRALMEASGKRGKQLEDILNRRRQYQVGENPIENQRARDVGSTLTLMATLVATVTFNAAFTLPGGFNDDAGLDQGMAVLVRKVAFQVFIITDAIALTCSLIAAAIIVWSTSRPENHCFLISLSLGKNLTWIALSAMGLAFVSGLFAVLSEVRWVVVVVCCIGCVFPMILYVLPTLYEWGAKQPRSNLANRPLQQYALLVRDILEGDLGYRSR